MSGYFWKMYIRDLPITAYDSLCYHLVMTHTKQTLLLLDANALLHRAWHAIPPLTSSDGTVVNAVYGIGSVVLKIIKDEAPDIFIACWDTAAPTFRHEAYDAYKATRPEKDQALYDQIPLAKELLATMGIPSIAMDGYEADDLIGTLSRKGVEEGYAVRIVTGDRDSLQLIDDGVDVLAFKKGVSETKLYDADAVMEEYGVTPLQVIDWKAISGDSSDNIKGIKGIGDKGATELIKRFGSLEGAIAAAKDETTDLSAGLRKKLIEGEADGLFSKQLVTIKRDVPIEGTIASFKSTFDQTAFIEKAAGFGFKSLIARVKGGSGFGLPAGQAGARDEEKKDANEEPVLKKRTASARAQQTIDNKQQAFQTLSDEKYAISFIKDCSKKQTIVIHVEVGEQGSLFGDAMQGLLIGDARMSAFIPMELLKRKNVAKEMDHLFEDAGVAKIVHDAKALLKAYESLNPTVAVNGLSHDTLLATYLLAAGERQADLDMIAMQELGEQIPPSGDERRAALPSCIFRIAERQRERMKEDGLTEVMETIEIPLIPILRSMERIGIKLDSAYLERLSEEVTKERQRLEKEMFELVGHEFNPASPIQLSHLFFEELGLPTKGIKKGKTGYSTAAGELEKLDGTHPIIQLIGSHREVSKLLSTYIDTLPRQADAQGRVHTTFNQAITSTGRLSSSDPNLQNIPVRTELGRKIRRAFIASPGMKLLSCDYSQIELRIAAALSHDEKMLKVFESGKDVHAATAAEIWNIPLEAVTKEQRRAAKAINFGILFGQGPQGLSKSAEISFGEAKQFIDTYFHTFKGIKRYLDDVKIEARKNGYVETLFGRRRPIPDIASGVPAVRAGAERMAINMPIQGTEADLIKLAMIEIEKRLRSISSGANMLLQVHDELVFEVPEKDVQVVADFAKQTMASIREVGCPIVVDAKVGDNWEEMDSL